MKVLLLESREDLRDLFVGALRKAGISVSAVQSIAEIERWPRGDIVVTRSRWFTTLWEEVGALYVIVLGDRPAIAAGSQRRCAVWLPSDCPADALVDRILRLSGTSAAVCPSRAEPLRRASRR